MNERRAERYDPRDADPLTVFDEADNMCPNCITPWKCNGPHLSAETVASRRHERDTETREEFRSGAVVLYLAVILAIVAGAAIAWLWWTFR